MHNRQQRALAKARQVLLDAEENRTQDTFEQYLQKLSSGNRDILKKKEFSEGLGGYLYHICQDGRRSEVLLLIEPFENYVIDGDSDLRAKSVFALSKFSALVSQGNDLEMLCCVFLLLIYWLEKEAEYLDVFGFACNQIHMASQRMLADDKYWPEVVKLTGLLHGIQNCTIKKEPEIHSVVTKLQASLATKETLDVLISSYLNERSEKKQIARQLLITLGRRSSIYLLNQLMHATDKDIRLQLIKIIPAAGATVVPILQDCLNKNPPWYVVRNVIFIISQINDDSFYPIIQPYLLHSDIRVQQQVLNCITKISGNQSKSRLLDALPSVHDELKTQIIMQFGQVGSDTSLIDGLLSLLSARDSFSDDNYTNICVKICVALRSSPTKEVVTCLADLIEEKREYGGVADSVLVAAQHTLAEVEPVYRHAVKASIGGVGTLGHDSVLDSFDVRESSVEQDEQSVEECIAQGDLEKAGAKIYSNAVNAARNKNFATAEVLRDKLLEINSLALTEVIRLEEVIDEERSSSINNHHISVWASLYEKMSTEEFNALYYTMRQESYAEGDIIVRAGENDPSLYFVNSGAVTLSCHSNNKESFLKRLQPGEVIGVGPFFSVSVWTVSMTAQTDSEIHVLSRKNFLELKKIHQGIEVILEKFCNDHDTVPQLLKMSGSDRRESARYTVAVKVNNILLDPYGNIGRKSFRGELIDISKGGLCFSIKISSKKNARLLLGRQIITEITLRDGDTLKCFGVIVGVKFYEVENHDFSVHVRFYRNLEQVGFKQVINLEI